jgi:hypothetical protein
MVWVESDKTIHTRGPLFTPSKRNMSSYSFRYSHLYSLPPHLSSFISPLYPNYPPAGPTRQPHPFTSPPVHPFLSLRPRLAFPVSLVSAAGWGSGPADEPALFARGRPPGQQRAEAGPWEGLYAARTSGAWGRAELQQPGRGGEVGGGESRDGDGRGAQGR